MSEYQAGAMAGDGEWGSGSVVERGEATGSNTAPGRSLPAAPDDALPAGSTITTERLERVFLSRLDGLYAYLRARLRDHQLAEDTCQQVFLRAWQARGTYRGDDDDRGVVAWLFRIAHNESANLARRRGRETSWDALGDAGPQPVDPGDGPDAALLGAERRRELARVLTRLTPAQRDLVELRFAAGLSLVQVAAVLGITDVAARQRLRRTLALLREEIDDPTTI